MKKMSRDEMKKVSGGFNNVPCQVHGDICVLSAGPNDSRRCCSDTCIPHPELGNNAGRCGV